MHTASKRVLEFAHRWLQHKNMWMPAETCRWIIAATTSSNCACHVLQNDVTLLLSSRYQKKWNSWLKTCRATENKKSEQFIGIHCVQANPQPTLLRLPEGDSSLRKVTFSFCTSCQIHPNPSNPPLDDLWFFGGQIQGAHRTTATGSTLQGPKPNLQSIGRRSASKAGVHIDVQHQVLKGCQGPWGPWHRYVSIKTNSLSISTCTCDICSHANLWNLWFDIYI